MQTLTASAILKYHLPVSMELQGLQRFKSSLQKIEMSFFEVLSTGMSDPRAQANVIEKRGSVIHRVIKNKFLFVQIIVYLLSILLL